MIKRLWRALFGGRRVGPAEMLAAGLCPDCGVRLSRRLVVRGLVCCGGCSQWWPALGIGPAIGPSETKAGHVSASEFGER
jgi:hypothetical protein